MNILFVKKEYKVHNDNKNTKPLNNWFDHDCYIAKKAYSDALNNFNVYKSELNRTVLFDKKRAYKILVKKKKRADKTRKAKELYDLRNKKHKEFWNHFKSKKSSTSDNIEIDSFKEYFAGLFNDIRSTQIDE